MGELFVIMGVVCMGMWLWDRITPKNQERIKKAATQARKKL